MVMEIIAHEWLDYEKTVLIDPSEAGTAQPKSGLSLKTDTSAYGQADVQTAQPGFGGQAPCQQAQPGFGGQAPYQQAQPGFGAAQAQPKAKKGMIIGVLAGAAVVLTVAFLLIFKVFDSDSGIIGRKTKSPEDVVKQCMEAMSECDADKLKKSYAPFVISSDDFEELEEALELFETYDIEYTYESVDGREDYSGDELAELEDDISLYYDTEVSLDAACDLDVTYTVSATMYGESYDESDTNTFTLVKYKGSWYILE